MTTAYERAMALTKEAPGLRQGVIDPSWHQGRGAFGGLLAAIALQAMAEDVNDEERVPRSLTMHFAAPASGPFELTTEVVRAGRSVSHATARFRDAKGISTFGSASFCKPRLAEDRYLAAVMPEVPAASALPSFAADASPAPGITTFFHYLDVRFCGPALPFGGAASSPPAPTGEQQLRAWVKVREPGVVDAPVAALLLDTLPPAITTSFSTPRPIASVDFSIQLFSTFPRADVGPDDFCLVSITSRWADQGYTEELRELWSAGGVLLGHCRQLIAIL